jgi:hypothetical protein
MRKAKLLALTLVFALMLMGAAYAAWTDELAINTTAGTGEMDIDFNWVSVTPHDPYTKGAAYIQELDGDDDKAKITITNIHPGMGTVFFDFQLLNEGTIPAKLSNVTIEPADPTSEELLNKLRCKAYPAYLFGGYDGSYAGFLQSMPNYNVTVQPNGGTLGFVTDVYLPLDALNGQELQNNTVEFIVTMDWEQAVPVPGN